MGPLYILLVLRYHLPLGSDAAHTPRSLRRYHSHCSLVVAFRQQRSLWLLWKLRSSGKRALASILNLVSPL